MIIVGDIEKEVAMCQMAKRLLRKFQEGLAEKEISPFKQQNVARIKRALGGGERGIKAGNLLGFSGQRGTFLITRFNFAQLAGGH
jgi:hypothetical protein